MIRMLLCFLLATSSAAAAGLYEAQVIVTGTDGRSRPEGLAACLAQVLAKVSGNPAVADDPRVARLSAPALLRSFAYLDRMSDQPKHDEQGTRDRPYDLVARFDPAAVDDALRGLGLRPWPLPRPEVAADIRILPRQAPPMRLQSDTDQDERHRAALLAAGERFGLEIALRPASGIAAPISTGAATLAGELAWSDADAGWSGSWRLSWAGRDWIWQVRGVSFDEAYRNAVGGAAAILSGNPL